MPSKTEEISFFLCLEDSAHGLQEPDGEEHGEAVRPRQEPIRLGIVSVHHSLSLLRC